MKFQSTIVLLSLIALAIAQGGDDSFDSFDSYDSFDQSYNYDTFATQFNRNYNGSKRVQHQKAFKQNYADLLERKKNGEDVQVNGFLDWTQSQLKAFFNYRPSFDNVSPVPVRLSLVGAYPASLDYRSLDRVTEIKNQGSCGSCWSFAATAQYESMIAIATKGFKYDLAEQYFLQCQKNSFGCDGGFPYYALLHVNNSGIPLQVNYLYQENSTYYTSAGKPICTNTSSNIRLGLPFSTVNYYSNVTDAQLQQFLTDYGPISVGVYAGQPGFTQAGASGSVTCPSGPIDHAVLLVGYNSTHWIIKNSWGTSWGDKGYGYVSKTSNCGITTYVNVAAVNYNTAPAPTPSNVTITITMTDSFGDGWNGNVLAIRQNSTNYLFGNAFTTGKTSGPVSITLNANMQATIQVSTLSVKTQEIGFTAKFPNGTVIYTRAAGTSFTGSIVFKTFCPSNNCTISPTVDYYLTMSDSFGDGWNGNILSFKQGTTLKTFGAQMAGSTMRSYGPIKITLNRFQQTNITVYTLGSYTEEVGYQLRTLGGYLVASRKPGALFYATTILNSFTPDRVSLIPVYQTDELHNQKNQPEAQPHNPYMISTYVLCAFSVIMIVAFTIVTVMLVKQKSTKKTKEAPTISETQMDVNQDNNKDSKIFDVVNKLSDVSKRSINSDN